MDTTCSFFIDNCYNCKIIQDSRKRIKSGFFPLVAPPLMMKVLGKEVAMATRRYNKGDHMDENF